MEGVPLTPAAVAADLRRLGLRPGDVLMVHASLRAMGPVAGGADGVVDAIGEALGPEGTMVMVLGAKDDWAWVNERPEADRPQLLQDAVPFDAEVTPAASDVGVLAEVFRQRPETVVSDHPEGRFAAAGPLAPELLRDVPWDDYYGPGSPLDRLIKHRGRVLRLGADRNTMTILHHAESLTSIEPKRRARRYRRVAARGGPQIRVVDTLDDEDGIVEYQGDDYFEDILVAYLETGRARSGLVGRAHSELIEAGDVVDFGVRWMEEHLQAAAEPKPLDQLRERLSEELKRARRGRQQSELAAIGSLSAALANAEAVPVADGPFEVIEGRADVPRRALASADIAAIISSEIAERERAIAEYRTIGADTTGLEAELAALERYRAGP